LRSGIEKAVVDNVTIAKAASANLFIASSIVSIYLRQYIATVDAATKSRPVAAFSPPLMPHMRGGSAR